MDARAQDRAVAPGAAGPAQDRARHLDRRDVADHRGRAGRHRFRPHARAALRARHRPHAAGDGARLAAPTPISGAAAPDASSRASAIACGRRRRTAAFAPYAAPEILVRRSLRLRCSICAAWGVADPASLAFLDPPPRAALAEARALLAATRRDRRGRRASPTKAAPYRGSRCRRGWRAWSWTLRARARRERRRRSPSCSPNAASAAMPSISRRGSKPSAATARHAPKTRGGWRTGWRGGRRKPSPTPLPRGERRRPGRLLASAYPERIAMAHRASRDARPSTGQGRRGEFLMANGRAAALEAARPAGGRSLSRHRRGRGAGGAGAHPARRAADARRHRGRRGRLDHDPRTN